MERTLFTWTEVKEITSGTWLAEPTEQACTAVLDDSRKLTKGALFVAVAGEIVDGHRFIRQAGQGGAAAVCVSHITDEELSELASHGIGILKVADTLAAFQALAACHRARFDIPVLAVTGSCGKTSTKEMCASILNVKFPGAVLKTEGNTNNHFGVPRNLFRMDGETQAAVIEAGSNHPGEIAALGRLIQPTCALITCIGAAHLEFFHDLRGVAEEKGDIYQAVRRGGWAVMPYACAGRDILDRHAEGLHVMTFGTEEGADVQAIYGGPVAGGYLLTLRERRSGEEVSFTWGIGGEAQASNAAGAAAVGLVHGMSLAQIAEGLKACALPGNRMRMVDINGIHLINDAYNANPNSMAASLKWLAEICTDISSLLVIIGDMRELGEQGLEAHRQMASLAVSLFGKEHVILVGELFRQVAEEGMRCFGSVDELSSLLPLPEGSQVFLKASFGIGLYKFEAMLQ